MSERPLDAVEESLEVRLRAEQPLATADEVGSVGRAAAVLLAYRLQQLLRSATRLQCVTYTSIVCACS